MIFDLSVRFRLSIEIGPFSPTATMLMAAVIALGVMWQSTYIISAYNQFIQLILITKLYRQNPFEKGFFKRKPV